MRLNLDMLWPLLPPLCLAAVAVAAPQPALDRTVLAMGTELRLHLPAPASAAALAECARIEAACSTWRADSAWSRLNAAQGQPVALAAEWLTLLDRVQALGRQSGGAFDPVMMALVQAWGLREGGRTPGPEVLSAARSASGSSLLTLDLGQGTARLDHPAAGVEEGGFLKGHALDAMRRVAHAPSGWIDFGGQVLAWGAPLPVEVADPRQRRQPRLRLRLHNASLAGSGTSERGRHILDPRTGEPCPAWGSVAVVAATGLEADAWSTALYVLGPEAGLAWAESHRVAAAFLMNDGSTRFSSRFAALHPVLIKEPS